MSRPLRVFLCHASQDKPAVRKLYDALKAEEWIDPWLDEEKLSFGQHWTTVIEDALDAADVVLIFLSHNSVQKEGFIQRELNYAWELSLEKPHGVIFLIPFRLDDCEVPRFLRSRQWGDYFGDKQESTYQILLRSLKQRYEQKIRLEEEELERNQREQQPKREAEELTHKLAAEQVAREKAEREAVEKIAPEKFVPAIEVPKKEIPAKPFTKLLDPASLFSNQNSPVGRASNPSKPVVPKKRQAKSLTYGFLCIGLLVLILGGFGLNYLIKNPPVATVTTMPTPITMIGEKGETLVYVSAGEFTMGNDDSNAPIHTVYLDAFWIDQTEVTNKQYQACVDAGTCEHPSSISSYTHPSYYGNSEFDNYPVVYVNWDKANRYCEVWVGGDLPTEAQWEKTARGTDKRIYPWGEGIDCDKANYGSNCVGDTTPVRSYASGQSPYGAYDMAGNVWEWVNDYYQSDYYADNASNPQGASSGDSYSLRGGSWSNGVYYARSANRDWGTPSSTVSNIGFRCARSP